MSAPVQTPPADDLKTEEEGRGPADLNKDSDAAEASATADAPAAPPSSSTSSISPPKPRKLLVILHGKRIDDDQVRNAIQRLKAEGHELVVRVTWDSGDVDQFVKEAVEMWDTQQYDTLVAGGGDGTLNELVVALLKHHGGGGDDQARQQHPQQHQPHHNITVAQLPLGTANDLASATGISLDPYEALQLALDPSTVHPIDVALVNGEVFTNLATAGPVSGVSSKDMSGTLKKLLGPAAVAVAGLQHLFTTGLPPIKNVRLTYPKTLDVKIDGFRPDQVGHMHGDLLALAAGQARQMGRMVNLCPDALLDDGLLDFTLLFGSLSKQARQLAADVASSGLSEAQGGLKLLRLPWLIVEADEDLKCNRDGEPMNAGDSNRLVFEVLPRRIRMHLPDNRLLVEGQDHQQQQEEEEEAAGTAAGDKDGMTTGRSGSGKGSSGSKDSSRKHFRWIRQTAMRTGNQRRPALLRDLWRAQQPPGRLSRALPRLQRLLGRALMAVGLMAVGFALGHTAQQQCWAGSSAAAGHKAGPKIMQQQQQDHQQMPGLIAGGVVV